ncbi:probable leucine-rich repeat receptor-like serine/threonine-protein kinase At3g14840 isoform X2 [Medicago truncatula]|uniref:probable leucine-rich repeat receptor-like serine/threonine-protein kinase At3g14840 isoform X2 n=1 Tax=Medicago truncatula TaxID=3880 RepID=UPI001968160C|nr:probable leucine-rich repeat receptor-like serine/threonine-protein kinase At3g14840 isoform X2 [Medicago truncatula]XP_039684828.1 probable leucine-rich repeat receptor-like serine/threonine-protein kinase At3g14840 isoform X2 [Medicago truncatula]
MVLKMLLLAIALFKITLSAMLLACTLPPDLVRLPFLQEIDLTLNYLNGTIPKEWATLKLVNISFYGNRLSGPIPKEFGNITTLKNLVLEFNQLSGNLPPELGSLSQIEGLLLSSNNFTGVLPATFAKLTALKQFRIGDSGFSGAIPNFIQSWINLEMLTIQGSGLSGPIPSGISLLKNLTDLTITDLNGSDSPFPQLQNMSNLSKLVLRSCNISGALPEYLGKLTNLEVIDLSNNKLSGQIPVSFDGLQNMYLLFLSGNQLSGSLPDWIAKPDYVDLSYNNFTITNFELQTCQQGSVNLFASSLKGNSLGNISCMENYQCPKTWYSLYINCGGKGTTVDGNKTYDDDSNEMGPSRYRQIGPNWALITAGHFFDSGRPDYYTWSNTTKLAVDNDDPKLYMDAHVSPNSLTYYGFCLGNGNYTVKLHFAEIMFSDDKTYSSIGRRVFDIYIQRKLVSKDFDIVKEAGGVGKAVIETFTASVTSNALEIRLYWAGKGTTTIPFGSVYGPLISAISVNSDFTPPSENSRSIPAGGVAAIVAAAIAIILIIGIMWWKGCLRLKCFGSRERKGLASQTGLFTLRQLKAATNNFDESFKIGEGGFGPVYKGVLFDGPIVAIKQLSSKSTQGSREFINEIGMISTLQHPNLVKLYGFCMEDDQLLLIYEYMENNSLAHALFAKKEDLENRQLRLDWKTRKRICIGIAKGLAYLHGESKIKIIHRDIKATNVLLDKDLNPKISDFGLAKLNEDDKTHMNTRIAGTYGYMAPEYAMHGYLTDKADVYSFGIVILEIVSGNNNTVSHPQEECFSLLDWARLLKEKDNLMQLVDRRLGEDFKKEEVMMMINVALLCTSFSPSLRPSMSSVVSMFEGKTNVQEVVAESSEVLDDKKYKVMQQYYKHKGENSTSEAGSQSIASDESHAFIYYTDSTKNQEIRKTI